MESRKKERGGERERVVNTYPVLLTPLLYSNANEERKDGVVRKTALCALARNCTLRFHHCRFRNLRYCS